MCRSGDTSKNLVVFFARRMGHTIYRRNWSPTVCSSDLQAPGTFEIALNIHPADHADKAMLEGHGWALVDARRVTADPETFRAYVQASGAEFSVAQGIYVETNSGWFSDRTAAYLAAGRPALVQDTGFSRTLPTGEGLLSFTTMQEAVEGVRAISGAYERHSQAARALAETYFDSDRVLSAVFDGRGEASGVGAM